MGRNDPARRPDLLLTRADRSFYVEATVVVGDDVIPRGDRPRVQQLYDAVDRVRHRNFLLHLTVRSVGSTNPTRRRVTTQLDAWLATLDPDREIASVAAGAEPAAMRLDGEGWIVDVEATGLKPDLRGRSDLRVIGAKVEGFDEIDHPVLDRRTVEMHKLDDVSPLSSKLRQKAGHYQDIDRPFVIALLCAGTFVTDRDILQALIGRISYQVSTAGTGLKPYCYGGGLWLTERGRHSARDVSAVLTAVNLSPAACAVVEPTLWTGPWVRRPLDPGRLPWARADLGADLGVTVTPAASTAAEQLGLRPRWPAGD